MNNSWPHALRGAWFLFLATAVIGVDSVVVRLHLHSSTPRFAELALLADLSIVLPGIYLLAHRKQGRRALVRALGLVFLGVWLASKIVPAGEQDVVQTLLPLRYAGLAVLVLIEFRLLVAIYRLALSGTGRDVIQARLEREAHMPPWVARLAAAEATSGARS